MARLIAVFKSLVGSNGYSPTVLIDSLTGEVLIDSTSLAVLVES